MSFDISGLLKDGVSSAVTSLGGSIKNAVSAFKADPTKLAEFETELQKIVIAHEETMAKISADTEQAYLKDVDSARQMQIEALKQNDTFSKRFVYYLAIAVIFLVFIFDGCFFFIDYPDKNRDMLNMIAGVLNSTALATIIGFFFGSSKGSKDAGERMDKMMAKLS